MNSHFSNRLAEMVSASGMSQKTMAARMGVSPAQLNKAMKGHGCENTTLAKIVAGVSDDSETRAALMVEAMRDLMVLSGKDARWIELRILRR